MFNLFFMVAFAITFGIVLAIFISRQSTPESKSLVPPEEDFDRDPKGARKLTLNELYRLGEKLCEENGLTIKERMPASTDENNEIYWIAESQNEFFYGSYVLAFFETDADHPFVPLSQLLEFKDFVKSIGSSKGFYFTTGYFTRDVHQPLEGPKVALYNRLKVLGELTRFSLA